MLDQIRNVIRDKVDAHPLRYSGGALGCIAFAYTVGSWLA